MNEEATAGAAVEETSAKSAPKAFPMKSTNKKPAAKKAAPAKAGKPAAKKAAKKVAAPKKAVKRPVSKKAAAKLAPKEAKKAGRQRGVAAPTKVGEFRTDYKAGDRVKVSRRNGEVQKGKVTSVDQTATGAFINVNIGDERKPVMIAARPAAVKAY